MRAGDQTTNTVRGVTEAQYQKIVKEEFAALVYEQFGEDVLDEGLWDKLKGRGQRIGVAFEKLYNSFAEVVSAAFGFDIEEDPSAADKVDAPEPEEVAQELESGDSEAVADSIEDMEPEPESASGEAEAEVVKKGSEVSDDIKDSLESDDPWMQRKKKE